MFVIDTIDFGPLIEKIIDHGEFFFFAGANESCVTKRVLIFNVFTFV